MMKTDYMIPIQGKDIVTKANVPAGKAATADFGVIDVTMKMAKPTGDTSKSSPAMPSYKTIPGRKQGSKLQRKLKTVNVGESTMKTTFKQYLEESADDAVFKKAADFLDTVPSNLEAVPKSVEDEVLDKGRELKHDFIKAALGKWVIRLFSALGRKFARVEAPTGKIVMYQPAKVAEAFIAPPAPYGTDFGDNYKGKVLVDSFQIIDTPMAKDGGSSRFKELKKAVKNAVGEKHFELGTADSYRTVQISSYDMTAEQIIKLLKLKNAKVLK